MMLLGALTLTVAGVFATASASADTGGDQQVKPAVVGFQITSNVNSSFIKCLTVAHFNTGNGAATHLYDCNGASSQRWTWSGAELRSDLNGKCLDVSFGNRDNGALVQMYDCVGRNEQQWDRNSLQLRSRLNNKCLSVANSNSWNGAGVLMWDCGVTANQQWNFA
jgi:hypothetical protein